MSSPVELRDATGAVATLRPELGGWLTRYARPAGKHALVEAIHDDPEVVARYPRNMWAGNPVLFPHVSFNTARGKEHQYELDGRIFESPQHGFARRVPWRLTSATTSAATIELVDSELTRPSYPFAFRHELTYRLAGGRLEWIQRIENRDSRPLPFSTGFHPYLRVPLVPGGDRNGCHVRLPRATRFNQVGAAESFFREPSVARDLPLAQDVSGTVFLGEFAEPEIALVDPAAGVETVVNWAGAPQYRFAALWSRSTTEPFYCIEPWTALPNSLGRPDGEVIILLPGGAFEAHLSLDVRPAR